MTIRSLCGCDYFIVASFTDAVLCIFGSVIIWSKCNVSQWHCCVMERPVTQQCHCCVIERPVTIGYFCQWGSPSPVDASP